MTKIKKLQYVLTAATVAVLLVFTGCSSLGGEKTVTGEPDTLTHSTPKGEGWMIELRGVRADEVWETNLEAWKDDPASGYGEYEFSMKGKPVIFGAMPLKNIIAMIDDADATMPYSFIEEKWADGYDITMTASDGYTVTFNTADFDADDFYLADAKDGEKINPMVTGNVSTQFWTKELASISLSLEPLSLEENDFELLLSIGSSEASYRISELEQLPYYIEDRGNFTNSHGNNFQYIWGGVKIVDLLNEYTSLSGDMSITIEAMDGYEMSYSAAQLMDESDGDWILAFKENGEYMPEDPGYIRLVKVGPGNPELLGHTSARMVKRIIIKNAAFRDFALEIKSGDNSEIMDRQTLQSGMTTWRTVVNHLNRKAGKTVEYMGMPIYEILGRYEGYDTVRIVAADGYEIALSAAELEGNKDVILAMFYGDGNELSGKEFPLVVAWDKDAALVPEGIKAVRNVAKLIVE